MTKTEIRQIIKEEVLKEIKVLKQGGPISLKIYGIVKDYQPYAFGPYTKSEASREVDKLNAEDEDGSYYDVELYNDIRDMLPPIDRMHIPKIYKDGSMQDEDEMDTTPFSAGDLADY